MTLLHCKDFGEAAAPTVLFIPGMVGSSASWTAPFRALARNRRLLLVDLLGFGYSPKPEDADYSLDDHLQALRSTLRARGVIQVDVVGHSMGALLALAYAARFPNEVRRIALLGMPWYRDEMEARHTIARSSLFNRLLALDTPLAHFACTLMCLLRPVLLPLMPWFMRNVPPMVARDALRHRWWSYSRTLKHLIIESQPPDWLRGLRPPVLFVHGTRDGVALLSNLKQGLADHADAVLEELDAGHDLIFTHAQAIASHLDRFLPH